MAGFDESILTVIVLMGFGIGALIMSKAGKRNDNKKTHRQSKRNYRV